METSAAVDGFRRHPGILLLKCGVQHYDWGGFQDIPALLGLENDPPRPYAELWVGAHPELPASALIGDAQIRLDSLIAQACSEILGPEIARKFDCRLPFLLKVLSARLPLSIQTHPDQQQALEGFARENQQGLGLEEAARSYKDAAHKPELISALTPFYALRGFRPFDELMGTLESMSEFDPLRRYLRPSQQALIQLYTHIMKMPQEQVDATLAPLLARLASEDRANPFLKDQPAYWALQADKIFSSGGHKDRGIFSIFLLNLVHLQPGEAMYLPAGELHAYLEGTGVEIMANSNNVLRGGLTSKYVDVNELLKTLTFTSGRPPILTATATPGQPGLEVYHTPAEEFELARLCLNEDETFEAGTDHGVQLAIVAAGHISIAGAANGGQVEAPSGTCFLVPAGHPYEFTAHSATVLFLASVPHSSVIG